MSILQSIARVHRNVISEKSLFWPSVWDDAGVVRFPGYSPLFGSISAKIRKSFSKMNNPPRKIVFVSTMTLAPWGGSEDLWSEAALFLARNGHQISASTCGWAAPPPQLEALRNAGVRFNHRFSLPPQRGPRLVRKILGALRHRIGLRKFSRWLGKQQPDLICISTGSTADDAQLIDLCVNSGRPYTIITHANSESLWPDDTAAPRLINVFQKARRTYFVSQANRHLLEIQLAVDLTNAEVIRNPCKVRRDAAPPWPVSFDPVRFACVGRLEPRAKGQDLLLQVMALEPWRSRPIEVSFYGKGEKESGLRRLAERLGLKDRARFCGHESDIERLWSTHHALVLPSRYEGLPLTIVEAMFCGRPVITTDVAGNAELIEDGLTGFIAQAPTVRHLNEAMERAWLRQADLQSFGQAAARAIRQRIPGDPALEFAHKLVALTESA